MATPEPNSPEAKQSAQKLRNIFYMIALANVVFVAIIMWPRPENPAEGAGEKPSADAKATPLPAAALKLIGELEKAAAQAFDGYNGKDAEKFARDFSANAAPPVTEDYFRSVIVGVYHEELGEITAKKLLTGECAADADFGMLVYEAQCKKRPKAKVSVNFRRENGALKVVQFRMEKL